MNLVEAVQSALGQYANFRGRARRSEYWWFALFILIVDVVVGLLDAAIKNSILGIVVSLAFIVPSLAVAFRRLHDTDRSAWWILIGLIPLVGTIILIVFACQDSKPGENKYGPSPKATPMQYGGGTQQWAGGV